MEKAQTFLDHAKYDDNKSMTKDYNYKRMDSLKGCILRTETKEYKNVLRSIEQYFSNSITYKNIDNNKKLRVQLPKISGNGRKKDSMPKIMKPSPNSNQGCVDIKRADKSCCDRNNFQCINGCDFNNEANKNRQLSANENLQDDENNNVEIISPIKGS